MREILFRGKRIDNGEWVKGDLLRGGIDYITAIRKKYGDNSHEVFSVDPETVGQFTSITSVSREKIFEGDIVTFKTMAYTFSPCRVEWNDKLARFVVKDEYSHYPMDNHFRYIIVGNIYDNPELLKEGV